MKRPGLFLLFCTFLLSRVLAQQPLLLPTLVGDKWGYCDTNGLMVIPAVYDRAGYFTKEMEFQDKDTFEVWLAPVSKGAFKDWINAQGHSLLPFDSIQGIGYKKLSKNLRVLTLGFRGAEGAFARSVLVNNRLEVIRIADNVEYFNDRSPDDVEVNPWWESSGVAYPVYPVSWNYIDFGSDFLIKKGGNGGLFGLVSGTGKPLVEPKFMQITNMYEEKYLAQLPASNQWLVYKLPQMVLDTFHFIPRTGINDGLVGVCINQPGKEERCGFVNLKGKMIVPLQYAAIYGFKHGIALGQRPNKGWDVLDTKGNVRIQIKDIKNIAAFAHHFFIKQDTSSWQGYNYQFQKFLKEPIASLPLPLMREGKVCYRVKMRKDSVYFDLKGKELGRHSYVNIQVLYRYDSWNGGGQSQPENLFYVISNGKGRIARRVGLYGFEELFKPEINVQWPFWGNLIAASRNGRFGVIDTLGKEILPFEWDNLSLYTSILDGFRITDSTRITVNRNRRFGFINTQGKVLMPCVIQSLTHTIQLGKNKMWLDSLQGYTYLCNGKDGCITFDSTYHFIYPFSEDFDGRIFPKPGLIVEKNHRKGMVDAYGNWIIPPLYKYCDMTNDKKYFVTLDSSGWCLWNNTVDSLLFRGSQSLSAKGNNIYMNFIRGDSLVTAYWLPKQKQFVEGMYLEDGLDGKMTRVLEHYKVGFIYGDNDFVIPVQFEKAESFNNGTSIVVKNSLYGVIDTLGNTLIPMEHFIVKRLRDNFFIVKKDSLDGWTLVNDHFQPIYVNAYQIDTFSANMFYIRQGNNPGSPDSFSSILIDDSGKVLVNQLEQIFPTKEGIAYMKNDQYFEYGISKGEPLKLIYSIGKTTILNDRLIWVGIVTPGGICYDNYGIQGLLKKDGTPVIPIARQSVELIKGTGDFIVRRGARGALFDAQGNQKSGFDFDFTIEYDFRVPFCYHTSVRNTSDISKTTDWWITRSGRPICIRR